MTCFWILWNCVCWMRFFPCKQIYSAFLELSPWCVCCHLVIVDGYSLCFELLRQEWSFETTWVERWGSVGMMPCVGRSIFEATIFDSHRLYKVQLWPLFGCLRTTATRHRFHQITGSFHISPPTNRLYQATETCLWLTHLSPSFRGGGLPRTIRWWWCEHVNMKILHNSLEFSRFAGHGSFFGWWLMGLMDIVYETVIENHLGGFSGFSVMFKACRFGGNQAQWT